MMKEELLKSTKQLLKMNLQTFADSVDTPPADNPPADESPKDDEPITLTSKELQSKLDSEAEARVAKVLAKKQAEWKAQTAKELEKAKSDAEEYAKMTEQQKKDVEYQKKLDALSAKEKEINDRELLTSIKTDLQENKLPLGFAEPLLSIQDNEKIKETIDQIKKEFDEAVSERVKESLRQDTPNNGSSTTKSTVNEFAKRRNEQKKQTTQGPNPWATN